MKLIREDKRISSKKMAKAIGISSRAVEKQIANLKAEGYLKRVGAPKGGYWEIISNND